MNKFILFFTLMLLFQSCTEPSEDNRPTRKPPNKTEASNILPATISVESLLPIIPTLADYHTQKLAVLASKLPVILLSDTEIKSEEERLVQQIAIQDADFIRDIFLEETKEPLHTEIMNIRRSIEKELFQHKIGYNKGSGLPFRVELYNFYHNTTTLAFVDVPSRSVLKVVYFQSGPPTINERLKSLAVEIALHTPEVLAEIGAGREEILTSFYPKFESTKCERSRHLCIAPVFTINKKSITVIVDLTDNHVVGIHSEKINTENRKTIVTERTLQNEYVMSEFCGKLNSMSKDNWDVNYELTSSDGLEIKQVKFNQKEVIESAKLLDWHVNYTFKDGFGYSDAMGCPMFSAAAVVAFNGPSVEEIIVEGEVVGFALIQDFRSPVWPMACNYRYENRYEFYTDGRFRITGVNKGLGCGVDGWYRPVFRIDLANSKNESVKFWNGVDWEMWTKEAWHLQDKEAKYSPEGYLFQLTDAAGKGYYVEPGRGQFSDGGRGDNAYSYISVKHKGEGEDDVPTIGDCCNDTYKQGPEKFLEPAEDLAGNNLVLWYVPQMKNDGRSGQEYCWASTSVKAGQANHQTWAGVVGPMFVPIQ